MSDRTLGQLITEFKLLETTEERIEWGKKLSKREMEVFSAYTAGRICSYLELWRLYMEEEET